MEQTSEIVQEGKFIDSNSYKDRASRWKAIEIERIKLDHFDSKRGIVLEVKKSSRREYAHEAQLKYYMFVLERNGIKLSHGVIEYPKLRQREEIWLSEEDRRIIPKWENEVEEIIARKKCPTRINESLCKHCAYFAFCFAD